MMARWWSFILKRAGISFCGCTDPSISEEYKVTLLSFFAKDCSCIVLNSILLSSLSRVSFKFSLSEATNAIFVLAFDLLMIISLSANLYSAIFYNSSWLINTEQIISLLPVNLVFKIYISDMEKPTIYLITSNAGKIAEFKEIIGERFDLHFVNVELPELQGDPEVVAKAKAEIAFKKLNKPVLVDDGSLCFNAYNGLPGPYIKWFLNKLGTKDLAKMVEPFEDKTAYALCILAYKSAEIETPKLFTGKVNGRIVSPRGTDDCGWFSIFQPEGHEKTFAELPQAQRNKVTHRFVACQQMINDFSQNKSS